MAARRDTSKTERARQATRRTRTQADRVLDRTTMRPVVKTYEEQTGNLMMRLSRGLKGITRQRATQETMLATAGVVRDWMGRMYGDLSDTMRLGTRIVLTEGVQSAGRTFSHVMQSSSPLDSIRASSQIILAREEQLGLLRRNLFEDAQMRTQRDVLDRLQRVVVDEMPASEIVTQVGEAMDGHLWEVQRTVRTETSFAWNSAQHDAVKVLGGEFPGLMQRWTEMVDDLSGRPMDDRVGNDSLAMHGQVARPGRPFTMPGSTKAPVKMVGKTWYHPPNRPNDRAVLTPWMLDWGIPGWQYQAGRRISL